MASGVPTADPEAAEVISMWVAPAARGRGVGDRLLAEVERWARERGARTLRLAVAAGNRPAVALYLRHGFRPTGQLGDPMPDGSGREEIMAKPLS
jgi:ribosomal protein S18 acetylase RimI-like enzyme